MLFSFWDKKSSIYPTYLYDSIRDMKLYPRKSNNIVTTSANTQFHVPKELVDYTLGFTISMDLYYDPATWDASRYNSICGRGNNTGFHSGMFVPGLISGNNFMGSWRNSSSYSTISTSGLTAAWYRFSMVVTTTTAQIKLLNLRTNVELSGNVISVGTVTNGDNLAFTFLSYGIDGYTGAYGSIGINFSNITISRNGACLLHVPLSSGADTKVVDICNKTQYSLGFFTASSGWAKLSDYFHANFYYGHTLYTKSGSNNLHICNGSDGSEISITPPSGYTRIANYKECRETFNQCESVFVLDNTTVTTVLRCTAAGTAAAIGDYVYNSTNSRWVNATTGAYIYLQGGTEWYWKNSYNTLLYYGYGANNPGEVATWFRSGGAIPAPGQLQSVLITTALYNADVDHILFTANTGVAKQIEIQDIYSDVVNLTLDRGHLYINSDSDKNFMLYKTDKGVDTPADLKVWKYVNKE